MVEGLLVGIQLIKKHKPNDTRSVMRFANRVLFSMMWEIIVGPSLPNHKNLFCKVTLAWLISEWRQEMRGCLVEETRHSLYRVRANIQIS